MKNIESFLNINPEYVLTVFPATQGSGYVAGIIHSHNVEALVDSYNDYHGESEFEGFGLVNGDDQWFPSLAGQNANKAVEKLDTFLGKHTKDFRVISYGLGQVDEILSSGSSDKTYHNKTLLSVAAEYRS